MISLSFTAGAPSLTFFPPSAAPPLPEASGVLFLLLLELGGGEDPAEGEPDRERGRDDEPDRLGDMERWARKVAPGEEWRVEEEDWLLLLLEGREGGGGGTCKPLAVRVEGCVGAGGGEGGESESDSSCKGATNEVSASGISGRGKSEATNRRSVGVVAVVVAGVGVTSRVLLQDLLNRLALSLERFVSEKIVVVRPVGRVRILRGSVLSELALDSFLETRETKRRMVSSSNTASANSEDERRTSNSLFSASSA